MVDEEVYTFIINAAMQPTSKIHQQLKAMSMGRYHSDQSYYYYMATANKLRLQNRDLAAHNQLQPKITRMLKQSVSLIER